MRLLLHRIYGLCLREKLAVTVSALLVIGIAAGLVANVDPLVSVLIGLLGFIIVVTYVQLRRDGRALVARLESHHRAASTAVARVAEGVGVGSTSSTVRRVLLAIETERLNAAERHRELLESGARCQVEPSQIREVEGLLQMYRGFEPRAPMPPSGGFAMNPLGLLDLLHIVRSRRPAMVLEVGSGTSSVWIAYALADFGGRLITIDHQVDFALRTQSFLEIHGLTDTAEVRIAPLRPVTIGGTEYQWYDPEIFTDISEIDLLVVDGPPEIVGSEARYPAVPLLEQRLAAKAMIVLDDAERSDEDRIAARWVAEFSGLQRVPSLHDRQAQFEYDRDRTRSSLSER